MVSLVNVNNTVFIHLLDSSLVYLYDSHDTPPGWFTLVYDYNLNCGTENLLLSLLGVPSTSSVEQWKT